MTVLAQKLFRHSLPRLSRFALRLSTNPCALPRVRFFFISLWRATQIGIRCYHIRTSLFCPFAVFAFADFFLCFSVFQWFRNIRRAIRRLAPQGGKALHSALPRSARARIPAHCHARAILSSFLMARHAKGIRCLGKVDFLSLSFFQYFLSLKQLSFSVVKQKSHSFFALSFRYGAP